MTVNLYVGTSGLSVWFSRDLGETWKRPYSESGLYLESRVWALSGHNQTPGQVYAGTDSGLYRWDEAARQWTHLPSPLDDRCIWALAQAPDNPAVILAGTHPAGLWCSDDNGETWRQLQIEFATECIFIGKPRVTRILFDPANAKTIWVGVEIDGVYRSDDGGETWQRAADGLISDDVHDLELTGGTLFATTNKGLHRSEDGGGNWQLQPLASDWQYTRAITPRADGSGVLFLANGNGPPGSTGRLLRSRDNGERWEDAGLPGALNSTPWCIATNPHDPMLIFVCTNLGQIFRSTDGGEAWIRLDHEFGEVRSIHWQPG
jgi:photosystem II stability/assembly factor-like uncharacterized protein